ncbi:MAG TPA: ATP-binding cassette domain-containing protein [Acidimicrobiales bacterium]|nr:ATP-binding cassette domain-containing protein [Acidimicrobiales bacterium]
MNPLFRVRGLTVRFGGVVALDGVDLDADGGELVGLIGPNGAGKTTFIDAVCGLVPSSGAVALASERVEALAPHERARRGIARTFQSQELFDDLTVRENLLVAAESPGWSTIGRDLVRPAERTDDPAAVDRVLGSLGLGGKGECLPADLTSSDRGLVALARALAGRPRVLLLDEPAAGLDETARAAMARRLRALADAGMALVLVDHDMTLVLGVCDRVTVLDFGRVIAAGVPAEVRVHPAVIEAYLGTATA